MTSEPHGRTQTEMAETVLDRLVQRVQCALEYNANAFVAPVALLWLDETGQWRSVVRRLAERIPAITLGDYEAEQRRGPAYWVRCVVAGTVDVGLPEGPLVLYMPGVGRGELRAVESCSPELAPIAELQYRSNEFVHPKSGREWSIRGLLTNSDRGLGLTVADGGETAKALALAIEQLLDEPIDRLSRQLLDADFLNDLVNPDPIISLLGWLDDPTGYREHLDDKRWAAFVQQCIGEFGFDPSTDGPITAAEKLGEKGGIWARAWTRFAEAPQRYPGIVERLYQAKPMKLSFEHSDAWPQDNEVAEGQLRDALLSFKSLTADEARKEATRLEGDHARRRRTVWANLGLAPLAFAIEQIVVLAELTSAEPPGDVESLRQGYEERWWRADDAALRALAATSPAADRDAVAAAVIALYRPWLDATASALQAAIGPMATAGHYEPGGRAVKTPGTVNVFVDGLRLDVAHRVVDRLAAATVEVALTTSLAPLPTVTPTAKPALVPVTDGALAAGPDLDAESTATGTKASIRVLRSLMLDAGVQALSPAETGDPTGTAWTEAGDVDRLGHDFDVRLVDYLDEEVGRIVARVRELLDAGWKQVDLVTDHGWLLLPTAMEKVDLPVATTEVKKGRCARVKDGAVIDVPTVPWFWSKDVRVAIAPGATCFEAGKRYEHGGVSLQECVVPRLSVKAGLSGSTIARPEITKMTWLGLLCRIEVTGVEDGIGVDIRALPGDPRTSIVEEAKETAGPGRVSLVVPDEAHEGERAQLVFVGSDGQILLQREVIVGRNR